MKTNGTFLKFMLLLLATPSLGWAGAAITYHGRILDQQDHPLEAPAVTFRIRIYSPNPSKCLLYEETRTLNMTGTQGVFAIPIGDGNGDRTTGVDPGLTIENIFANNGSTISSLVCNSGTSYAPQSLDQRQMVVSYDDHTGYGWDSLPAMALNYVPFAVSSHDTQSVGGVAAKSVLKVVDPDPSNPAFNATPLTPTGFTELMALINGSSTQYEKIGKLNGVNVPALSNGQVLGWNGGAWSAITPMTSYTETDPTVQPFAKSNLPACAANSFLQHDGAGHFVCVPVSGASGGTVTSVSAGTGLKTDQAGNAAITATGSLSVDVGTGANQIVQMDPTGKLPVADGSNLTGVTASALSNTASINTSGNITTTGNISAAQVTASGDIVSTNGNIQTNKSLTAKDGLFLYDAKMPTPNSVGIKAPSDVTGSYVLTLPSAQGGTGQVLGLSATTGQLTWINPSTGSVTNVTATAPLASTGGATPDISLPQANSTTDGYLSKTDFDTFNNKQSAGNYVTTLSGDVTSSGFAAGTVTTTLSDDAVTNSKIANDAVTATKIADGAVNSLSKVVSAPTSAGTNRLLATDPTTGTTIKDFYCSAVAPFLKWTGDSSGFGCQALTSADITGFNTDVDARINAQKGQTNGLVTNGGGVGKITAGNDGVYPATNVTGDLFVATDSQKIYRYNGSGWDLISSALGSGGTITGVANGTGLTGGGTSGSVTLGLANTAVTAGNYGSPTEVPTFTVDAQGRLTAAGNVTISGTTPGGAAGGDLSGTYPNPTVAQIQGRPVNNTAPVDGQVMLWDTNTWKPQYVRMQDIRNTWGGTAMIPTSACAANEAMVWSVITDRFMCQTINDSTKLALAGGTMSGSLDMNGNKILNASNVPFTTANPGAGETGMSLRWNNGTGKWEWFTAGVAGSGVASINGDTAAAQTLAPVASATSYGFTTAAGTHTLTIPSAATGGVTAGTISNSDYTTFNNKQSSTLNDGQILVGNASNVASPVTMSGDATISNSGALTLKNTGTVGTYYKVTTDAQGRVVSGTATLTSTDITGTIPWSKISSTPTTLSGYGITDSLVSNGGGVGKITAGNDGAYPGTNATGDLFVATDSQKIYRYNGGSWDLISSASGSGGTITNVTAGTGLTGGGSSGAVTLNVNAGVGPNQIVQLDASSKLPAVDGSQLTNLQAAQIPNLDATKITTGTLPVVRGGTGQSSYTDGQLLIGNSSGNTLTKATLTAGPGVSITNGNGSITISSTGGTVTNVTGSAPINVATGGTTPVISLANGTAAGQVYRWDGTSSWVSTKLKYTDLVNATSTTPWPTTTCAAGEAVVWDSITDKFNCSTLSIATTQLTGTLAAAQMPAFTGDVTSSAGSTALTLANSGVTAGTYKSVTVDAKGRVTGGTNPTTLAGYGITDAVMNGGGVGKISSGNDAAKPGSPATGDLFVATDSQKIYRYNGSAWDLMSSAGGSGGTVTTVSVTSANGMAGTVSNATSTPAITLSTTVNGMVKGNGTALSAATAGTDYSAGTSALSTGLVKSTTGTGALSIAGAADITGALGYTPVNKAGDTMTGMLTLATGTTTLSPMRIPSGILVTTPVSGNIENDGSNLYWTNNTPTRQKVATYAGTAANGQLLIGNGSGFTLANITAGSGISVTNSAGGITIATSGGGGTVTNVSSANTDIDVTNGTTTPVLTLNSTTTGGIAGKAGMIPKLDASGLIDTSMIPNLDAAKITSGTLPVARGGTGQSTYTDGQLLIGNSAGNTLTKATLTAGTGISIANGNGSITISSTGGTVTNVTGTAPITVATGTTTPTISLANGSATGQVYRWSGSNWAATKLTYTDLINATAGSPWPAATCTSGQAVTWDSVADKFSCTTLSIATTQLTGTLAAAQMPAFTGDVTSSAGSTALTLANSGVTAGTYKSVTVDAKGRVTAGTNPTTLAGYGITDAVMNGGGVGKISSGLDASKPGSPTTGDLFVATDTQKIYRYNGSVWDLMSSAGGSGGTVTTVSVTSANGLGGTVSTATTTPAITLTTSVNGIAKGNGTALSAATAGTDYSAGTSALATGLLKSTTGTGALSIAGSADITGALGYTPVNKAGDTMTGMLTLATGTTTLSPMRIPAGTLVTTPVSGNVESDGSNLYWTNNTPTRQKVATYTGTAANGQLMIGNGSGFSLANITAGTGISVTNSAGGITINATGGTGTVTNVTSTNSDISVATGTTTPVLTLNSTTTGGVVGKAGMIPKLDAAGYLDPSFIQNLDASDITTGILPVVRGGTGQSTYTDGQLLIGNTAGNTLSKATLTAGSGISITNGNGSITISTSGGGGTVTNVTGTAPITVATGTTTPAISLANGSATGQVYRWSGAAWTATKLTYTDLINATSGSPWPAATCTSGQAVTWDSVTDKFNCTTLSIATTQLTGTLAAAQMPAFTGDVTSSAGSTALTLANSGVTAGTYKSVTVDAKGRVTGGTNPTTLAGYGITDAVMNGGGVGKISSGLDASKPGSPASGDLFVATDSQKIYRYNGSSWDLMSSAGGSGGTVTTVSVTSANGMAGTVSTATTTPAITLSTTVNGMVKGNGTALSAATSGTDYSAGTSALATGLVKSTTGTGALSIAGSADITGALGYTPVNKAGDTMTGMLTLATGTTALSPMRIPAGTLVTTPVSGNVESDGSNLYWTNNTPTRQKVAAYTGTAANGQLLIGNGSGFSLANITAGTGISVTNSAGGITINATGGTGTVTNVTSSNSDISVATGTTTPVLSLNSTTTGGVVGKAGMIPKLDAAGYLDPSFIQNLDASDITTGTLPVARGGTGQSSYTDGQLLIGNTVGNTLTKATLTAGSGISITNGNGSITISSSGGGGTVTNVTGTAPITVATGTTTPAISLANGSATGQVYRWSGAAWTATKLTYTDLINATAASPWPSATCTSGQAVTWDSVADKFNCTTLSIATTQLTGTLAAAQMPAHTGDVTSSAGSLALTLANSGVTAGTYKSVTVDAKGRVTAGTNPTTLAGYGITDAVMNGGGVGKISSGLDASKPGSPASGDLFVATDSQKIYRYNGSSWDLMSSAGGSGGTVTTVSVTSANGLGGTVSTATTTPAITLTTSVNGIVKGNGTALSAATSGTDYSAGTSALATGLVKSTTGTGALSIAGSADITSALGYTPVNKAGDTMTGMLTLATGTTALSPARIPAGVLVTTPVSGNIESDGSNLYWTNSTPARQKLASYTGTPANGQLMIGNGTGFALANITAGSGISVTNSAGGITIAATGGSGTVTNVTSANSDISVATGTTTPVLTLNSGTTGGAGDANKIAKLSASGLLASAMIPALDVSTLTTGVLPIARGGTNNGTLGVTAGGILYMDGSKAMTTAAGTSGQALISAGAGAPAFGTLGVAAGGTGATTAVGAQSNLGLGSAATKSTGSSSGAVPLVGVSGITNNSMCTSDGSGALICNTAMPVSSQWTTSGSNIYYNTGNVGIGQSSPTAGLHLLAGTTTNAPLKLTAGTNLTTPQAGAIEYDGTNLYYTDSGAVRRTVASSGNTFLNGGNSFGSMATIGTNDSNDLAFERNNSVVMNLSSVGLQMQGTYGINGYKLTTNTNSSTVYASSSSSAILPNATGGLFTINGASADGAGAYMNMTAYNAASTAQNAYIGTVSAASGYSPSMVFGHQVGTSNYLERMRIDTNGYVGIGTATPNYKLDVSGGHINLSNGYSYQSNGWYMLQLMTSPLRVVVGNASSIDLSLWAGAADRMYINSSTGYVGVGMNNPAAMFNVKGPQVNVTNMPYNIGARDSAAAAQGVGGGIGFEGAADAPDRTFSAIQGGHESATASSYDGYLRFLTRINGQANLTERMRISSVGNVGIGTAAPTAPLHVSTTNITGNIATFVSTGAGGAGCSIAWNGTSCSSDARLKENVVTVDASQMLNELLQLRPVHFTWIKDPNHEKQTGFIAQELEKHFPEFITTDANGYKQVNYAHFVSVLTATVQELYKRINGIEAQQAKQTRQIASIESHAASKDELKAANAEIQKLKSENAAKDKELEAMKSRLEKIEKALSSK